MHRHTIATQTYQHALDDLAGAHTAGERAAIVRRAADLLGVSLQTVYRNLRRLGWESGRKTRSDSGESCVSQSELEAVAAIVARGRNKRGQPNVPLREAHRIAVERGLLERSVSYGHLARRMREAGLSLAQMRAPAPAISRVSQHPNHVWFFDISVAIQWYFRDERGRALGQHSDAGARFYEGKRQNLAALRRVIHRYLVTDHRTGAFYVRYYYSSGERAEDVVDFLYRAMAAKPDAVASAYPLRGVPRRLVLDQGSAMKAQLVRNLLSGLGVTVEYHAPRNPKASGAVESRHNHWQRAFEGRLALRPARDLAQLNGWAVRFCAQVNAERPHSRHGRTPMSAWVGITPEQLTECPDRDTFFQLAAATPREGTLDNRLWLRAKNRLWQIRGAALCPRQKVTYRLSPFVDQGIRVWDAAGAELAAEELRFDDAGLPLNGRRHVWDDDTARGATAPTPPAQQLDAEVASAARPVDLDVFNDLDARLARSVYLSPQGQDWTPTGDSPLASAPPLGPLEARELVADQLGRPLTRDEAVWWKQQIGDGITRAALLALLDTDTHTDAMDGAG